MIADSVQLVLHIDRRFGKRVVTDLSRVCRYEPETDRYVMESKKEP